MALIENSAFPHHPQQAHTVVVVGLIIETLCLVVWASIRHCPFFPSVSGLAGLDSHILMVVALPPLVAIYQVWLLHFTSHTTSVMLVVFLWVTYSNSAPRATQKRKSSLSSLHSCHSFYFFMGIFESWNSIHSISLPRALHKEQNMLTYLDIYALVIVAEVTMASAQLTCGVLIVAHVIKTSPSTSPLAKPERVSTKRKKTNKLIWVRERSDSGQNSGVDGWCISCRPDGPARALSRVSLPVVVLVASSSAASPTLLSVFHLLEDTSVDLS